MVNELPQCFAVSTQLLEISVPLHFGMASLPLRTPIAGKPVYDELDFGLNATLNKLGMEVTFGV